MWTTKKLFICGANEVFLTQLVSEHSAYGTVDFEIGPDSGQQEMRRVFRAAHLEPLTILVRLAVCNAAKTNVADKSFQEMLLPHIDSFNGLLLILFTPIFIPIISPLRSRCDVPDFMPQFIFRKPKGSLEFLASVIGEDGDRALRRTALLSLDTVVRKIGKGTP